MKPTEYDIIIIGGGLAGLALAIEQKKNNRSVLLFEKKSYPFHKVCGEYISNESWNYLNNLGVPLQKLKLPKINQLKITTAEKNELNHPLKKGGFGISRYLLDEILYKIAKNSGVIIKEETSVKLVEFNNKFSHVFYENKSVTGKIIVGAYGKRSNLDKTLQRKFIRKPLRPTQNYVGIKYHIKADLNENLIGLHIFKNGYCGISKVEGENRFCLCYLTLASNLQAAGDIESLEKKVLSTNSYLKEYLKNERHYDSPLVISQVNFNSKKVIENHIFMLGDAAGLIVPLCGNGMSMALHSAHQFNLLAEQFFNGSIDRQALENKYKKWWNKEFSLRLAVGRLLQKLFYIPSLVNPTLKLLSKLPRLTELIIRFTHGKNIQ